MPAPTVRPAADPLDDIDRNASGVDSAMERQDRADLPGERSDQPDRVGDPDGDVYLDATREIAEETADPEALARGADPDLDIGSDRLIEGDTDDDDPDIDLARESLEPAESGQGADDDDPIDETERAGDDAIR
jgi:hypothetical protein